MRKQAYIIHSYLHLRPVAKWTLTIWSGSNTKVSLIWMKRCISSWSYYLKYMQDINQEGMEHFRQLSHECNQYPFHEAVSFKFNRPINMCSSMFADLSTKANSEWSVKKTRSPSLDGDLEPNDFWNYWAEYTWQPFFSPPATCLLIWSIKMSFSP